MFDLFRKEVASQVVGPFDGAFWTYDMLQAAQAYPSIFHSCTAMAAMHTQAKIGLQDQGAQPIKRGLYVLALQEYSNSIKHVTELTRQKHFTYQDQESLLMSCILLTGLCSLMHKRQEAVIHAKNGLRLFNRWQHHLNSRDNEAGVLSENFLTGLFSCLEVQLVTRFVQISESARIDRVGVPRVSPEPLTSGAQAFLELQPLMNGLLHIQHYNSFPRGAARPGPEPDAAQVFAAYYREFYTWKAKWDVFLASPHYPGETKEIQHIRIYWIAEEIALHADLTKGEIAWDDFLPQFTQIVERTEQLYRGEKGADNSDTTSPIFSYSQVMCHFLNCVAGCCRDRPLRQRIVNLLKGFDIQEGIWDSRYTAAACEARIRLEESAMLNQETIGLDGCECRYDEFVCNDHRVVQSQILPNVNGVERMLLTTVGDVKRGYSGTEVLLEAS